MKKQICVLLTALMAVSGLVGCTGNSDDKTGQNATVQNSTNEDNETMDNNKEIADFVKQGLEDSDRLMYDGTALLKDGSILGRKGVFSNIPDEDIKAFENIDYSKIVRINNNKVALTKDGEVYSGANMVYSNPSDKVVDIVSVGSDSIGIIKESGINDLYYLNNSHMSHEGRFQGTLVQRDDNIRAYINEDYKLTLDFDFGTKNLRTTEFEGWEDVVMLDVAGDIENDADNYTVAGIKSDGSTVAIGKYADEIKSFGKVKGLAMERGLIVAIKEDGTVCFGGENGKAFESDNPLTSINNAAAVKMYKRDNLSPTVFSILTDDDNIYYVTNRFMDKPLPGNVELINKDNGVVYTHKPSE